MLFAFSFSRSASAADLTVTCDGSSCSMSPFSGAALFEEPDIKPGYNIFRKIFVTNNGGDECSLYMSTKNWNDPDNLRHVLFMVINNGASDLFGTTAVGGGASNSKNFADLFGLSSLYLGAIPAGGGSKTYSWVVTMDPLAGNEYQGVTMKFDFDLTFECGRPTEEQPQLIITKTNDKKGKVLDINDIVTYTVTIFNNGSGTSYNTQLEDVQPVGDYFDYLESSGTLKLEPAGAENPITATHAGGNRYLWTIGNILPGQTYTLKYQLQILSTSIPGTHHNIALARGQGGDGLTYYSNVVFDPFDIGQPGISASYTGEVEVEKEGTVLGAAAAAAEKAGQVLGAATGSKTFWLIVSLLMIVLGRVILKFSKKFAKIFKNLFLALLVILPMVNAKPVRAADATPPVVKIVQLPEYLNKRSFEISYTALDAGGAGLKDVHLEYKKEGGGWQDLGTYTDHSRKVSVDNSKINEDKKYYFKATACDNGGYCASDETFTNIDTTAPPKPENYSKEKTGPQSYKIKWHNADSDDLYKVYIYRSDKKDYDANDSTKVSEVSVTKNTDSEWVDAVVPDSTKDYYYAIRSVDKAGNASELVGDTYMTTITTTTTEEAPVGEAVTGEEVIVGQEPVVGAEAPGEGVGAGVEGKILGEEEVATEEAEMEAEELKPEGEVLGESFAEKLKKLLWLWIAIGGVGVVIFGYWFFGIKRKSD